MSSGISMDQYGNLSGANSDLSSFMSKLGSDTKKKNFSEDTVTISQEAQELIADLKTQKANPAITSPEDAKFARVVNALPKGEGFSDMLTWLKGAANNKNSQAANQKSVEIDRNVYQKEPNKYATLWKNMYEHYGDTFKEFGLDVGEAEDRKLLKDATASTNFRTRFTSTMDKETKNLLNYFNIQFV